MKHLISIFLLFGFLTQIIFLNSCSDDNAVDESPEATLVSRTNQALSDFPLKTNDLFVFRDTSHFMSFYANAAALAETSPDDLRSNFIDKNFVSVAHLLENDVFERFEDAYSPFLTDPVMMEICNPYYEFQIGDVLVTYINNTQILISDINDINTKNEIRQLEKGKQISVNQIPGGAYWGEDTDIQAFFRRPCTCKVTVEMAGCNRIRVHGNCKDLVWGSGEGNITVFLGIDPPSPLPPLPASFTGSFDGNFEYFFDVTNPMLIRVFVNPDCILGNTQNVEFLFNPNENSCDNRERDSGWASVINGTEAMRYRVQYYSTHLSSYEKADNESIRWNNVRNRWESKNANRLETTISASRRNSSNCVIFATEIESKSCNNCKSRNASVNTGVFGVFTRGNHCDGDVVGTFKKIHGSITLNATATLDFDCCL